jgi:hypothetical protein
VETKHEILQKTGVTSDQFDKAFRKFFGSECEPGSVPGIWLAKFLQTLTNRIHSPCRRSRSLVKS